MQAGPKKNERPTVDPAPSMIEWVAREAKIRPSVAVVLGSGLSGLSIVEEELQRWSYETLPQFPQPSVPGHAGELALGRVGPIHVAVFHGRFHWYEGYEIPEVTVPIRLAAAWGVQVVLLTCAVGGITEGLDPGDFVIIKDHLNLMGQNPLRGVLCHGAVPFLDLSEVYDAELRRLLEESGDRIGCRLREGIYAAVSGPTYETAAEVQALHRLGADVVGMSLVPEAVVARALGLRVAGLACVTNRACGFGADPLDHEEVLAVMRQGKKRLEALIREFLARLAINIDNSQ